MLGVLPGVIGLLQATETLKWILGKGRSLSGRMLTYDALEMTFRELKIRRDPECSVCKEGAVVSLVDYEEFCAGPRNG